MLFTLLTFCALIISELFSELGVYQSSMCKPSRKVGKVTTRQQMKELPIPIKHYFKAAHIFQTDFLDKTITDIREGFPLSVTPQTCIPCLKKARTNSIISCSISSTKVYPIGTMRLLMHIDTKKVDAQITGFEELEGEKHIYTGMGDIGSNGVHIGAFLFSVTGTNTITYFEYASQAHFMENYGKYQQLIGVPGNEHRTYDMGSVNRAPIRSTNISWKETDFTQYQLATALSVYRTIQLESVIKPIYFNETSQSFKPITTEDIYRAVLSMNLAGESVVGEYYMYTSCGAYDSRFLIPFFVSSSILLGLGLVAYHKRGKHRAGDIDVPFTGDGWFHVLRKSRCRDTDSSDADSSMTFGQRLRHWVKWYVSDVDEMVLVETPRGFDENPAGESHVEWCSDGVMFKTASENINTIESTRARSDDFVTIASNVDCED